MEHPWLAYALVGALGAGAGLLVAGLPERSPDATTIVTMEATAVTTTTSPGASTTAPGATTTATTDTTSTPATSTTASTTTTTTTTTIDVVPLPERADIAVLAVNGSGAVGVAGQTADVLRLIGYSNTRTTDGTEILGSTVVYYADGFEAAAFRMVDDLELGPTYIVPLETAPEVIGGPGDAQILVYIGVG